MEFDRQKILSSFDVGEVLFIRGLRYSVLRETYDKLKAWNNYSSVRTGCKKSASYL
jgi:hypothetical protein